MNVKMLHLGQGAVLAIAVFGGTMTMKSSEANAVVCGVGVYRAGCVAAGGAYGVRGVARRTARRTVRRRSDILLKHDISLLGHLQNGVGFYRFSYLGSDKAFVGVLAQEVETVMPGAVMRGSDGYLQVDYGQVGVKFQSYDRWIRSGGHVPQGLQPRRDEMNELRVGSRVNRFR